MPPANCLMVELLSQARRVTELSGLDDQHQLEMRLNGIFYNSPLSCEKDCSMCVAQQKSSRHFWVDSVLASWTNSSISFLAKLSLPLTHILCVDSIPICTSVKIQYVKWGVQLFLLVSPLLPTPFVYSWCSETFKHIAKDKKVKSAMYLEIHPVYGTSFCISHPRFLLLAAWRLDDLPHELFLHTGSHW